MHVLFLYIYVSEMELYTTFDSRGHSSRSFIISNQDMNSYWLHMAPHPYHTLRSDSTNLVHGRDGDLGNGPDFTTLAGSKSAVSGTTCLRNSRAKGRISLSESDNSVQVLLLGNSSRATVVALSTGTVSTTSQYSSM